MAPSLLLVLSIGVLCVAHIGLVGGLQCYSCKSSGINEMDANIRCLEKAYLESCDEFYNYYNDVEEELYDYYYNFADDEDDDNVNKDLEGEEIILTEAGSNALANGGGLNDAARPAGSVNGQRKQMPYPPRLGQPRTVIASQLRTRKKRYTKDSNSRNSSSEESNSNSHRKSDSADSYEYYDSNEDSDSHEKHRGKSRSGSRSGSHSRRGHSRRSRNRGRSYRDSSEYEYEYYEDETTTVADTGTTATTTDKAPAKPEHYCYSETKKSGWETYTVEKGCKKILYCKDSLATKPDWAHPWNFCCDRSRCNVKLVKDKPQRVFGMGCRRQDDCIQGHNSRPVCPHFFKTCPRISRSLVKMECRAQTRTMASVKGGMKFRTGQENKCYCSKGYFPKGPICTSGASSVLSANIATVLILLTPGLLTTYGLL